jgi:hypothetical protein
VERRRPRAVTTGQAAELLTSPMQTFQPMMADDSGSDDSGSDSDYEDDRRRSPRLHKKQKARPVEPARKKAKLQDEKVEIAQLKAEIVRSRPRRCCCACRSAGLHGGWA